MAIYPTGEQFQELMKGQQDHPVVMLNLLRFKPQADASHAGDPGPEPSNRSGTELRNFAAAHGARGGQPTSQRGESSGATTRGSASARAIPACSRARRAACVETPTAACQSPT